MRFEAVHPDELPFGQWGHRRFAFWYVAACVLMVGLMHSWRHVLGWDPLAHYVIHSGYISWDLWSLVHVVFFAGAGFCFPNNVVLCFMGGCAFEVVEAALTKGNFMGVAEFWEERGVNSVWDIFFNSLGFRLGQVALLLCVSRKRARREKEARAGNGAPRGPEKKTA
eukprot:TRINITY_DN44840_c0_g1_i1.p2 TRINITY_DN44840_c0_g1~~TRINITY_DN44840_c0_g1_i1.p2  ORF type:complete len:167 (+),score=53.20 TRINITY_DN44840_c0_g1_i1:67-567(+)